MKVTTFEFQFMLKKHGRQMKSGTGETYPVPNLRPPGCLIISASLHSEKLLNETKGTYSFLNKHLMNTYCVPGNEHNKKMSKKLFYHHKLIAEWKGKLRAPHSRAGQELSDGGNGGSRSSNREPPHMAYGIRGNVS